MSLHARAAAAIAAGTANPLYPVLPSSRVSRGGFVLPHRAEVDYSSVRESPFGPRAYCSACGALTGDTIHHPENRPDA